MRVAERRVATRTLLATMSLLQVVWVAAIWLRGVANNPGKLWPLIVYSILAGVAVAWMPARLASRLRELREQILENDKRVIGTLCLVVVTIGLVYASNQIVMGNETQLLGVSRTVANEGVTAFFAGYASNAWLGTQHPPLVPLVYGFVIRGFGDDLLVLRLASLFQTVATTLLTYLLARKLYDRETGFLAALFLVCIPSFIRFGVTALLDMPLTLCFTLTLLVILRLIRTPTHGQSLVAGIIVGVGLLTKYPMALIYPVMFSCYALLDPFRRLKLQLGTLILVSLGMLAGWFAYAHHIGVFATHSETILFYAGVVTTVTGGRNVLLASLLHRLPSALGVYNIPILLLGGTALLTRKGHADLFVLLWIGAVSLPLIFTLPEPRYFMPAFPGLAIAMARGLKRVPRATEQVIILAVLYCGGALYLFADWYRTVRVLNLPVL